jgi:hypothetical protein
MNRLAVLGVAAIGGVAGAGVGIAASGARAWERATAQAVDRLARPGRDANAAAAFTLDRFAELPAPVARYLAFALTPGQPLIRRARIEHEGEFQARPGSWSPFTSVEHVAVHPPGFVWDATIRMLPLVPVRVRDSYLDGRGAMRGAAAGLVTVVDQQGTREMAEATLMRFLAEATWFPTALLPGDAGAGVVWTAIDDSTARATLTDGGVTAVVDFHFGPGGEVTRTSAMRHRDVDGTPVLTPWVGHSRDYRRLDGMMVPTSGEVEWITEAGRLPYWRGRITRAAFEMAR